MLLQKTKGGGGGGVGNATVSSSPDTYCALQLRHIITNKEG